MRLLENPPTLRPVRLAGVPRWAPARRRIGQAPWVEIRPEVKIEKPTITAPISIELGGLPLSLGLFAGSGLAFLMRGGLPQGWPQTVALVAGGALAVAGIANLVIPKAAAAAAAPAAPGTPPQPTIAPVTPGQTSAPLPVTSEDAFESVGIRIVSPIKGAVIDGGLGSVSVPARIRLSNPASEQAGFDLLLEIHEQPEPFGTAGAFKQTHRIVMAPRETRDVDLMIPVSTWAWNVTRVRVRIFAGKQRLTGGPVDVMDNTNFVVD